MRTWRNFQLLGVLLTLLLFPGVSADAAHWIIVLPIGVRPQLPHSGTQPPGAIAERLPCLFPGNRDAVLDKRFSPILALLVPIPVNELLELPIESQRRAIENLEGLLFRNVPKTEPGTTVQ